MKKITYNIVIRGTAQHEVKQVTGYEVKYPDFPGFTFAVHKGNGWQVSELSTGLAINAKIYTHTRKEAIDVIHERLVLAGIENLTDIVNANPKVN